MIGRPYRAIPASHKWSLIPQLRDNSATCATRAFRQGAKPRTLSRGLIESGSVSTMARLGNLSGSRDNNLNLIRAIAATSVLVSHAFPLTLGIGAIQPLSQLTGYSMGTIAVAIFFVISGFLIAASYDNSRTRTSFVVARALRLIPGLFVSLVLVALAMGPIVTDLSIPAYFAHSEVWAFIARNTTLAWPQFTLPGVFEANPYPTVEGSIWTLVHEAICYTGIFAVGVTGLLARRYMMAGALALFFVVWVVLPLSGMPVHPRIMELHSLAFPFAIGTAFYLWRDRIPLVWPIALTLVAASALTRGTAVYEVIFMLTLAYGTFWLAYVPGGWIRRYNQIGDYSYGIYIYAFPIQGLVVWLWGPMTPWMNMALALPLTLIPSIVSWHLVEKPALTMRGRVTEWLLGARTIERA